MKTTIESRLDNALVRQKDQIIKLINSGQLCRAVQHLSFVRDLWESVDYGYKYRELMQRVLGS